MSETVPGTALAAVAAHLGVPTDAVDPDAVAAVPEAHAQIITLVDASFLLAAQGTLSMPGLLRVAVLEFAGEDPR